MYLSEHTVSACEPASLRLDTECVVCNTGFDLVVKAGQYYAWRKGALVQRAFPNLDPQVRELFFLSGICATCWAKHFSDAVTESPIGAEAK